jgi:hypothetical protein
MCAFLNAVQLSLGSLDHACFGDGCSSPLQSRGLVSGGGAADRPRCGMKLGEVVAVCFYRIDPGRNPQRYTWLSKMPYVWAAALDVLK